MIKLGVRLLGRAGQRSNGVCGIRSTMWSGSTKVWSQKSFADWWRVPVRWGRGKKGLVHLRRNLGWIVHTDFESIPCGLFRRVLWPNLAFDLISILSLNRMRGLWLLSWMTGGINKKGYIKIINDVTNILRTPMITMIWKVSEMAKYEIDSSVMPKIFIVYHFRQVFPTSQSCHIDHLPSNK